MASSKQMFLLLCAVVCLVATFSIWLPLRTVIVSLSSIDLTSIGIKEPHQKPQQESQQEPHHQSQQEPRPYRSTKLYPQFLLFGDSITEAAHTDLVLPLSKDYLRRADVINRGFSGYTAPNGLAILSRFFPATAPYPESSVPRVRLMTIFFGANDATHSPLPAHVPLERYKDTLRQIANYEGFRLHETKRIFITPPPVYEHKMWNGNWSRSNNVTGRYAAACREVAASLGLPVLDLWTMFMNLAGWKEDSDDQKCLIGSLACERNDVLDDLLQDGLHLSTKGYELLLKELRVLIENEFPSETPKELPGVYPLDADNLNEVLAEDE